MRPHPDDAITEEQDAAEVLAAACEHECFDRQRGDMACRDVCARYLRAVEAVRGRNQRRCERQRAIFS